jgi:hypothetical protein
MNTRSRILEVVESLAPSVEESMTPAILLDSAGSPGEDALGTTSPAHGQ